MTSSPLQRAWKQSTLSHVQVPTELSVIEQISYLRCIEKTKVSWTTQEEYLNKLTEVTCKEGDLERLAQCFAFIFLGDEEGAKSVLEGVEKKVGFTHELTGLLGRKTRHQTKSSILLAVNVLSHKNGEQAGSERTVEAVALEDPDLVEEFLKKDDFALDSISCQILLVYAFLLKHFQPKNDSDTERMLAYVNRIILEGSAALPETRLAALYLKSVLEGENSRYLGRSMTQVELIRAYMKEHPINPALLPLMPTMNQVGMTLAEMYCKLGQLKKALAVFQDLQMVDEQVACLLNMGCIEEAEGILLKHVQDSTLPLPDRLRFMCTLGSLKKDVKMVEQAWDLSQGKFYPAARLLGKHFYGESNWIVACEWLKKVVEAMPNDCATWFLLGCSLMRVKAWDDASQALLRTTQIDPEHSQAWNNLAAVYSQKGLNAEALEALKRASKLDYNNARIWQNMEMIAEDLKDAEGLAMARKRLSELGGAKSE